MNHVYIEKVSGKNVTDRPVLNNMMAVLKSGEKLVVDSISRFAMNTKDLIEFPCGLIVTLKSLHLKSDFFTVFSKCWIAKYFLNIMS
ncbi:recombinase family protein [Clostridium lacusfryxellense]|nr:recombinase family protein [Clostridium lacusfryxellense]